MRPAIRRIVFPAMLRCLLLPAACSVPWSVALEDSATEEGGADGFNGAEIAEAPLRDACAERDGTAWALGGWGWHQTSWGHTTWGRRGRITGEPTGGRQGGIEPPPDFEETAMEWAAYSDHLAYEDSCHAAWPAGIGGATIAFNPIAGGGPNDGHERSGGGSGGGGSGGGWRGGPDAFPGFAPWPAWPGGGVTRGNSGDRDLGSPPGPTSPPRGGDEETLLTPEPPPDPTPQGPRDGGGIRAVVTEPATLALFGVAMLMLGIYRRERASS